MYASYLGLARLYERLKHHPQAIEAYRQYIPYASQSEQELLQERLKRLQAMLTPSADTTPSSTLELFPDSALLEQGLLSLSSQDHQ